MLSRLTRAIEGRLSRPSSREWREDEPIDPAELVPAACADIDRCTVPALGRGTLRDRGLVLGREVRLPAAVGLLGGKTNLSATLVVVPAPRASPSALLSLSVRSPGGERGRLVRMGRLPGDPEILSRCEVRARVGVNSGPVSRDKKREESSASTVSISKWGAFKYVTEAEKTPMGCVTGSKVWVAVSSEGVLGDNVTPKSSLSGV